MKVIEEPLSGLKLIAPSVWEDDRGYFFESYQKIKFEALGIYCHFVQDNEAYSKQHALRGLHYQTPPYAQAKLVRVVLGEVFDVAVDIRPDSPTYGQYYGALLSASNKQQLFIPHGFAHGYVVLSEEAIFCYKTDNFYHKESEGGIRYDDPSLQIDWKIDTSNAIISEKDFTLPFFGNHKPFI